MYNQWRESARWRDLQTISVARSRYHYGPDVFQNKLEGFKDSGAEEKSVGSTVDMEEVFTSEKHRKSIQKDRGRYFTDSKVEASSDECEYGKQVSSKRSWSVVLNTTMRSSKSLNPQSQPYWVVQRKLNLSR